ncbi:WD40/YVTN/BNR-like repeat-containing protein, partial [Pseudomonas sp. UFMG81]|uniref:WD40/YVTN/BNR-like repeat-containing protein n=1 Tax=Pseudomonas sp. UFMG81 TaxID=2745936 RepID=UPI00188DDF00
MGYLNTVLGVVLSVASSLACALEAVPAVPVAHASQAMLLGAAWATQRVVAVGDHGVVLLSDDTGRSYRQARSVPVSSPLTAVSFSDASHGWAVGHWGAILASTDGGESWQVQRLSQDQDRPLFAVHFFDARRGVAVGLWSLVLTTDDGGATWSERRLPPPAGSSRADLNLMSLFVGRHGTLYATAERGQLLRSDDRGQTWRYLDTGYEGTLWTGAVLADGSLLVGGQRGTLLRGSAEGTSWQRIALDSRSSITAIAVQGEDVLAVGLDGLQVRSGDGGRSFAASRSEDGASFTAALAGGRAGP